MEKVLDRAIIGIPMGDPAGIGPEIVVKALVNRHMYEISKPLVVGSVHAFQRIAKILGSTVAFHEITHPDDGLYVHGTIDIIDCGYVRENLEYGKVQALAGRAAYECIEEVTRLALRGEVHAIATTPINKEAIRAAEIDFIGHTEMLESLSGTKELLTMFQVHTLRVFFLTRHVSLRRACDLITKERVSQYIELCSNALRMLGVPKPLLAVAGLNPHNGEHGLFGNEEDLEIVPAVQQMQDAGFNVVGPVPPDSVFHQALTGRFDGVLSLYHDQGHIATKTLDFERTIALTIGMPFLRTSVDHGTAFDIAGQGIAASLSMEEAIRLAAEYAKTYKM
ncbi:MAG: 4-hydroxythreonine-4-phosphate dehydrogenase PdxA [Clostridia bacterium]